MQLYKINEQLERLIDAGGLFVDTETGEVFDDTALDALAISWDEKVTNTGCLIKNMAAEEAAIKAEMKALKERADRLGNRVERLKQYLGFCLEGKKFHSPQVDISFRRSEQVVIGNMELLPSEYIIIETTQKANKVSIKQAIKSGHRIPGAELMEKQNIQIK